jgi:Domain of unknown function (DUF4194)
MTEMRSTEAAGKNAFSLVLVSLMKGVVHAETEPKNWQALLDLQARVRDHVAPLGLELIVDEAEGYAYLRQRVAAEGEPELPRLVARRPLGFQVSLLLVLLPRRHQHARRAVRRFGSAGAPDLHYRK